ncbi:MAG: ScpA family protein [Candidatus Paceibacterota bacterium]|jgi:segregation and condensation protein A
MPQFAVKNEKFEGPLGLLLTLITERKMHISEVSLAEIADTYISYASKLEEFPIHESAEFLLVASTLMLIKSRSLLPGIVITDDEQSEIKNLEERLRLYAIYQEAGKKISEEFGARELLLPYERKETVIFAPPADGSLWPTGLSRIVMNLLNAIPTIAPIPQTTIKKIMSLEEAMQGLLTRVTQGIKLSFREAHEGKHGPEHKLNIVLSFLALLELMRRGKISVEQHSTFHDILIQPEEVSTPIYG